MTRGKKITRFLLALLLVAGGILALFSTGTLAYIIGGVIAFLGLIFMSDKSGKTPGLVTLIIGLLFIADTYLGWNKLMLFGFLALVTGGYVGYDSYKKINSY